MPRLIVPVLNVDVEPARKRAIQLAAELGELSQTGVARARESIREVDIERARESARDLLRALGDASVMVRDAAAKVDTDRLRSRVNLNNRRARRARKFATVMAGMALRTAGPMMRKRRAKSRRLWAAWRS